MGMMEKMSKRKLLKTHVMELDKDTALSFVCDSITLVPVKPTVSWMYKNIDAVLSADGEPICRLKGGGDVVFIEPSARSFKIDVFAKSKLTRIFPTFGRLRVDWDGLDLHVTRLADDDETL